jgi:hypothetical protein
MDNFGTELFKVFCSDHHVIFSGKQGDGRMIHPDHFDNATQVWLEWLKNIPSKIHLGPHGSGLHLGFDKFSNRPLQDSKGIQ